MPPLATPQTGGTKLFRPNRRHNPSALPKHLFLEIEIMSHRFALCAVLLCAATAVAARADMPKHSNLPLKKVVIFSSGVGFFEHDGQVSGDARVKMEFKTADINDLLKSMVVQDLDGGRVSTITYASKDPITKTLKGFAIDLTTNPTMAQLLQQLRGERVMVEAPNELRGVILGV